MSSFSVSHRNSLLTVYLQLQVRPSSSHRNTERLFSEGIPAVTLAPAVWLIKMMVSSGQPQLTESPDRKDRRQMLWFSCSFAAASNLRLQSHCFSQRTLAISDCCTITLGQAASKTEQSLENGRQLTNSTRHSNKGCSGTYGSKKMQIS